MTAGLLHSARRLIILTGLLASASYGYSVLTHEAIVDSVWESEISKLLLKRFTAATPDELAQAHAYVYGGCLMPDMGYYPFSSHLFSDLTHYVRSGDFIVVLIGGSQNINEYAFALGALAHYAADNNGHRIATNLAVPILYPELRRKFGKTVTYGDNPLSHLRTEFGFDVLQVAQGRYAPDRYRSFIGFEVSRPVLERAFLDTYGIELSDVFGNLDLALGSFRYSVSSIIPGMTRIAWKLKKDEFIKEIPGITKKKFLYNLSRSGYEREWGRGYVRSGFWARLVTWVLRAVPKSGPFRSLAFRPPTSEVEKMFMASFNASVDSYTESLHEVDADRLQLLNQNFDVGSPTVAGQYAEADAAYDQLLDRLANHHFGGISAVLRGNMVAFYRTRTLRVSPPSKKASIQWNKVMKQFAELQASDAAAAVTNTR